MGIKICVHLYILNILGQFLIRYMSLPYNSIVHTKRKADRSDIDFFMH